MRNVSMLSGRIAGWVSLAALGAVAAFATPAAAADLYTGPEGPPPAAYGPPPAPYVEYAPVPVVPVPVPVYRPYVVGAPYWYGRPYWRGYWAPRYAGWYGRPWGPRW
jgi:hypothetical protein